MSTPESLPQSQQPPQLRTSKRKAPPSKPVTEPAPKKVKKPTTDFIFYPGKMYYIKDYMSYDYKKYENEN